MSRPVSWACCHRLCHLKIRAVTSPPPPKKFCLWTVAAPMPMDSSWSQCSFWLSVDNSFGLNPLVATLPMIFLPWPPGSTDLTCLARPHSHINQFLLDLYNICTLYTCVYVHIHLLLVLLLWLKADFEISQSWTGPWIRGLCSSLRLWATVLNSGLVAQKKQC